MARPMPRAAPVTTADRGLPGFTRVFGTGLNLGAEGRDTPSNVCLNNASRRSTVKPMSDDSKTTAETPRRGRPPGSRNSVRELPDGPVDDLTGLTPRQQKVLVFLREEIEKRGYPPSM